MAKKKTSFEERNIRSVEAALVRKVISSHHPSPGPGHYYGTSVVGSLRIASAPTVMAATLASTLGSECTHFTGSKSATSPGYRGYSFGKGRLEKSIMSQDELEPVYEFRASVNPHNATLNNTLRLSSLQASTSPKKEPSHSLLSTTSSSKFSQHHMST